MSALGRFLFGGFADGRTWRGLVFLAAGMVSGLVATVVVITGVATGVGLLVLVIGLPLIWASLAGSVVVAGWDARLGRRLVDPAMTDPGPLPALSSERVLRTMGRFSVSGRPWRSLVWHLERAVVGLVAVALVLALSWTAYGLVVQAGWGVLFDAAGWVRVLAVSAAAASLLLVPHIINGFTRLLVRSASGLLGESTREQLARETARSATAEARVDLARDLHDSVGHSVTAAVLQASAARAKLATDPQFADQALAAVEERGRAALEELDRVLAVMRDGGAADRQAVELASVDDLVATARRAGQPVTFTQRGDLDGVPAAVGREGYRVVQEALTNAMRHAVGARTVVLVEASDGRLVIDVESGPGGSAHPDRDGGGRGLSGIAERVRMTGGSLSSGPTDDGGFRVHAELPYDPVDG